MIFDDEINEIGEEFNIDVIELNLVNNVAPKFKEFGEPSRKNIHYERPRYVPIGHTTNFSFWVYPKENHVI